MRSLKIGIAVAFVVMAAAALSQDADDAVRKGLMAQYSGITQAFQKKDISGLAGYLASDFSVRQPDGHTIDRPQVLKDFKTQMDSMSAVEWKRTIKKLTISGKQAVATVRGEFTGMMGDARSGTHSFGLVASTRDTWTQVGTAWKLNHSELLSAVARMDGKIVGPPSAAKK